MVAFVCVSECQNDGCGEYNPYLFRCCNGVKNPISFHRQCCGTTTYSIKSQICCNDEPIPNIYGCCEGNSYPLRNYLCCNGNELRKIGGSGGSDGDRC